MPKYNHETYFRRKKTYGFNLQAISGWSGRFIYGGEAGVAGGVERAVGGRWAGGGRRFS